MGSPAIPHLFLLLALLIAGAFPSAAQTGSEPPEEETPPPVLQRPSRAPT